jgi:hypothetical protein
MKIEIHNPIGEFLEAFYRFAATKRGVNLYKIAAQAQVEVSSKWRETAIGFGKSFPIL